jgi:diguanylate cyclase (GGDEF)-like protein
MTRTTPHPPDRADSPARGRQAAQLRSLTTIAAAVGASRRFRDVLELAAEEARRALGAASLSISRWERDEEALRTLINVGELGAEEQRFPEDERYALANHPEVTALLRRGESYVRTVDDPSPGPGADLLRRLGKESEAGVPIVLDTATWGELWASTSPGQPRLRPDDIEFMRAVADQVAAGLAHAEYFAALRRFAFHDPLTGLANRRSLDERLAAALAAGHVTVTLMVCDVDGLKAVNDRHGHHAGDQLLVRVARALRVAAAETPGALACRIGGDEFCVLVVGRGEEVARRIAHDTLQLLDADRGGAVSLSCGVASTKVAGDAGGLLHAADTAQYAAKAGGRGGVVVAWAGTHTSASRRPRRRRLRDRSRPDLAALLTATLDRLDHDAALGGVTDRLAAVACSFTTGLGASAWVVSHLSTRGGPPRVRRTAGTGRVSQLPRREVERILAEAHAAGRLLPTRAGRLLRAGDRDWAGQRLLFELGYGEALVVSASDRSVIWLLQLYADTGSGDLAMALPPLRLLAGEAVLAAPPRESRPDGATSW